MGGRLVRWILLPGLGLVLLGFFGSNLVLQSGWFRGRVGGKLNGITRLSWTVSEASWSPWGGARLGGLKAEAMSSGQGELAPICEIEEIRIQPHWGERLNARLAFREVRVKSPRGKVPMELLLSLMAPDGSADTARIEVPHPKSAHGAHRHV